VRGRGRRGAGNSMRSARIGIGRINRPNLTSAMASISGTLAFDRGPGCLLAFFPALLCSSVCDFLMVLLEVKNVS
jgi:hypothetical protein